MTRQTARPAHRLPLCLNELGAGVRCVVDGRSRTRERGVVDVLTATALGMLPWQIRRLVPEVLEAFARDGNHAPAVPSLEAIIARASPDRAHGTLLVRQVREAARIALERGESAGIRVIGWGDPAYPQLLARIADPPFTLWYRGTPGVLSGPAVAVVGSRAASRYAIDVAHWLASELATRGAVVVSGLARGVDGAAHRGALEAAGSTVAVLGSGVDVIYPPEHRSLAQEIRHAGTLLSELPPGTPPRRRHFPTRNRLISGLSLAVVLVEASARSGSLITARLALEQGREVMAVPGSILTERNRGAHRLLKDGAKLVEDTDDILEELHAMTRDIPMRQCGGKLLIINDLLEKMEAGEAYDLDQLGQLAGRECAGLLPELLDLQLRGLITRSPGGRFVRCAGKW